MSHKGVCMTHVEFITASNLWEQKFNHRWESWGRFGWL